MKIFVLVILGLISCMHVVGASVRPTNAITDSRKLENELNQKSKQLAILKNEINQFEQRLNSGNQEYLDIIRQKNKFSEQLLIAKEQLRVMNVDIEKKLNESERLLKGLVVNNLYYQSDSSQIMLKKILASRLQKNIMQTKILKEKCAELDRIVSADEQNISMLASKEKELSEIILNLEEEKRNRADTYLSYEEKNKIKQELSNTSLLPERSVRVNQVENSLFQLPLSDYVEVTHKARKRISFTFTGQKPVYVPKNGVVAYTGALSAYGNIVIINHGNEQRSVVFGHFIPKINKGSKVNKGDLLGYTEEKAERENRVFFEIRSKEKPLDAFSLIDKTTLKNKI